MPDPWLSDPDVTLYHGDVLATLRELPAESVDCVVTSPPYWGLRDYGTGAWEGGDAECDHKHETEHQKQGAISQRSGRSNVDEQRNENYRDTCGKCGATRIDQQLGLEPTPEQYVEHMVEVFREVRRVLAAHGTVWVNLGDSFASKPAGSNGFHDGRANREERTSGGVPIGLKPKDLVGIPWRVAFALQQPYYAGRIKDERDRIWLAAMVDAEGCIHIHKRAAGANSGAKHTRKDGTTVEYARTQDTYGVMVSIDNTSKAVIDRVEAIVGQGSRYTHEAGTGKQQRKRTLYRITLTGQQSRELLCELYPHLVAKQHEARIAYHAPSSGGKGEEAWYAIKALHNGQDTLVDYAPPPTLFEPGWYLRSDVIWGKPNPMPESVTDRPTKAHEFVFLLTKKPRYYFDAEAVREPHKIDGRRVTTVAGSNGSIQHRDGERWPNAGRNIRSVWEIATQPYPEAHFATFPEELARRCIAAACPEQVCRVCGKARERITERPKPPWSGDTRTPGEHNPVTAQKPNGNKMQAWLDANPPTTTGFTDCDHGDYRPGIVLDPFMGSGTVAYVARKLGRHSIGIDLSESYLKLAARRLQQQSLFAEAM